MAFFTIGPYTFSLSTESSFVVTSKIMHIYTDRYNTLCIIYMYIMQLCILEVSKFSKFRSRPSTWIVIALFLVLWFVMIFAKKDLYFLYGYRIYHLTSHFCFILHMSRDMYFKIGNMNIVYISYKLSGL